MRKATKQEFENILHSPEHGVQEFSKKYANCHHTFVKVNGVAKAMRLINKNGTAYYVN